MVWQQLLTFTMVNPIDELTLAQYAMIAGLPKAPSAINPVTNAVAAKERRNHVLDRMLEQQHISDAEHQEAINAPVTARYHGTTVDVDAPYIAEMVRQQLEEQLGDIIYTEGLQIYTTIDAKLQLAANDAVTDTLMSYDKRHGLRQPTQDLADIAQADWLDAVRNLSSYGELMPGVVTNVHEQSIDVLLKDGRVVPIHWDNLKWAKPDLGDLRYGHAPEIAADIVSISDIIYVESLDDYHFGLGQAPQVEGAPYLTGSRRWLNSSFSRWF